MQSFRFLGAIAVAAAFVPGAAYARSQPEEAQLRPAAAAPQETAVAGLAWRCEGDQCLGADRRRSTPDGLLAECRKVTAVVGPVSSYRSRGRELSAVQLRACNRRAVQVQSPRN